MKKHEEGYVLLYVMVVISLLSVVAASICTISLRNLQTQHASLNRTEAMYQTEGKVEALATIAQGETFNSGPCPSELNARDKVERALKKKLFPDEGLPDEEKRLERVEGGREYTVQVVDPMVTVTATVFLPTTVTVTKIDPPTDALEGTPPTYQATLTTGQSEYRQYTVTDTAAG